MSIVQSGEPTVPCLSGCNLKHYSNYVNLEGPSWNVNQDSQQCVACHVSPQAFQPKARIEPQVKSSSTPSTPFSVPCLLTHRYFNVYVSHRSLNCIIISLSLGFVSLQEQVQNLRENSGVLDSCIFIPNLEEDISNLVHLTLTNFCDLL